MKHLFNMPVTERAQQLNDWLYMKFLQRVYQKANTVEELPWYKSEHPQLLLNIINNQDRPGRALDIGCGTGSYAILLAQQGYKVTGVDFINKAINIAMERADKANVKIEFIKADILQWQPAGRYDLIVDMGCLHGITGKIRNKYRERVLKWLENGGDYFLIHFEKKHFFDYCPIGPRRYSRKKIVEWLSPDLEEKEYLGNTHFWPFPLGKVMSIRTGSYWFKKRIVK